MKMKLLTGNNLILIKKNFIFLNVISKRTFFFDLVSQFIVNQNFFRNQHEIQLTEVVVPTKYKSLDNDNGIKLFTKILETRELKDSQTKISLNIPRILDFSRACNFTENELIFRDNNHISNNRRTSLDQMSFLRQIAFLQNDSVLGDLEIRTNNVRGFISSNLSELIDNRRSVIGGTSRSNSDVGQIFSSRESLVIPHLRTNFEDPNYALPLVWDYEFPNERVNLRSNLNFLLLRPFLGPNSSLGSVSTILEDVRNNPRNYIPRVIHARYNSELLAKYAERLYSALLNQGNVLPLKNDNDNRLTLETIVRNYPFMLDHFSHISKNSPLYVGTEDIEINSLFLENQASSSNARAYSRLPLFILEKNLQNFSSISNTLENLVRFESLTVFSTIENQLRIASIVVNDESFPENMPSFTKSEDLENNNSLFLYREFSVLESIALLTNAFRLLFGMIESQVPEKFDLIEMQTSFCLNDDIKIEFYNNHLFKNSIFSNIFINLIRNFSFNNKLNVLEAFDLSLHNGISTISFTNSQRISLSSALNFYIKVFKEENPTIHEIPLKVNLQSRSINFTETNSKLQDEFCQTGNVLNSLPKNEERNCISFSEEDFKKLTKISDIRKESTLFVKTNQIVEETCAALRSFFKSITLYHTKLFHDEKKEIISCKENTATIMQAKEYPDDFQKTKNALVSLRSYDLKKGEFYGNFNDLQEKENIDKFLIHHLLENRKARINLGNLKTSTEILVLENMETLTRFANLGIHLSLRYYALAEFAKDYNSAASTSTSSEETVTVDAVEAISEKINAQQEAIITTENSISVLANNMHDTVITSFTETKNLSSTLLGWNYNFYDELLILNPTELIANYGVTGGFILSALLFVWFNGKE